MTRTVSAAGGFGKGGPQVPTTLVAHESEHLLPSAQAAIDLAVSSDSHVVLDICQLESGQKDPEEGKQE